MIDRALSGSVPLTSEMFDPSGPWAEAVRASSAKATNAPTFREGAGWSGMLCGFCPVQGYGNVDGLNWYFRARYDAWSFEVWASPFGEDGRLPAGDPCWSAEGSYGETDFDASWMPFSHAWGRIEASILAGRESQWSVEEVADAG
jgi:hypothetical protein